MATDHNFKVKKGLDVLGGDVNLGDGFAYKIDGTTVVDSSRNLSNIGTISSGNITSSGDVTISGNLTLNYGAGNTVSTANGSGITIQDAMAVNHDATILWDTSNDRFNFSDPVNVDIVGPNNTPSGDALTVAGYGIIGNRSANVYITNSNSSGGVQIGVGGAHNTNPKLTVSSSTATFTVPITTSGRITSAELTITGGTDADDIYINNTSPTLAFTDSNSFTDSNDKYIIRGTSTGKLQFQWHDNSASTTTQTFLIDQSGNAEFAGIIDNTRNNSNVAPPNTADHTAGTRISFYDASATAWYAMGIESNTLWFNSDANYKWYQDGTERMSLTGANLDVTGAITSGTITSTGQFLSKVVSYSANQSGVYATAASTAYTGASTHWGTHGARHTIKTNSGGVPRITVDWEGGEKYSLDNSGNATFAGTVTWTGGSSTNANTAYGWGNHASAGYATNALQTNDNITVGTISSGAITTTGRLTLPDGGYSIGNELHVWKRAYSVSSSSPQDILYHDGSALPNGGAYRVQAHISGTGTDQSATAVFWNQNGTWKVNVTYQSGTSSNHPEFIVGSNGNPQIHIDHASNYGVAILHERLELSEATGTDNKSGFGADGYLSEVLGVLRHNPDGGSNHTSGNRVFTDGYHPNADALTTTRTINGVSFDGTANITVADSTKLPLAGGTMTGTITTNISTNQNAGWQFTGAATNFSDRHPVRWARGKTSDSVVWEVVKGAFLEYSTGGTYSTSPKIRLNTSTGGITTSGLNYTSDISITPAAGTDISLFQNHNSESQLRLMNNRQDASNVPVSSIVGYNSTQVAKMIFYRGGGGSSGFIRFQNKPTNAASLTDVFQVGDGSTVGYGVDILAGGLRIGGNEVISAGRTITAPIIKVGDGNDGYFYSDSNGRTAFRSGDFYIQDTVTNYYNYATNQYMGNASGDNIYFRGNPLSGNNWGIDASGNTHTSQKLAVKSSSVHASYDFYNNGTTYLNGTASIDDTLTMTGDNNISLGSNGSLYYVHSSLAGFIPKPGGAQYTTQTSTITGACKITLPTHGGNDMISFWVDIFDYTSHQTVSYYIAGYAYQTTGNNEWVNETAISIAAANSSGYHHGLNVRFGADGSNSCLWIGETNTVWSYPQVVVRDLQVGYASSTVANADDWDIEFVTSFDTVDHTIATSGPRLGNAAGDATVHRDLYITGNSTRSQIGMSAGGSTRGYFYATNANDIGILDQGGAWAIRHLNDQGTIFYSDGATQRAAIGADLVSGDYGSMVVNEAKGGWLGYSLNNRSVLMHDNSSTTGIYNDLDNEWYARFIRNSSSYIYFNGHPTLETMGAGIKVNSSSGESTSQVRMETNGTLRGFLYANNGNNIGILDAGGEWAIRHVMDQGTEFRENNVVHASIGADLVSGSFGSMVVNDRKSGWGGYSINNRVVFMHDHGNTSGIYNDVNNHWMIQTVNGGTVELFHNGSKKLETTTSGVTVTGNLIHDGLTPTAGTDIDQIYTVTDSLTLTTSYQDTSINSTELATGTYIMQLYIAGDHSVGGSHYNEFYSGVISWYGSSTNSSEVDEIVLHRAGHAPNSSVIHLRTQRHPSGGDNLVLQIKANYTMTAARNYQFKFRRMI